MSALKVTPAEIADALQRLRSARTACWPPSLPPRLPPNCPRFKRDGGFVREGYDADARRDARAARRIAPRRRRACRRATPTRPACARLKIRHNNVLGYFVEVTAQHGDKLLAAPLNATFIHRQTLAGQMRFTTTELGELEAKIASAADRALGLELEIFERLAAQR